MPKIVPKSIQTCFERDLGRIFRKKICPVFHGWSSLQIFSKKIKKFSKFQPKTHKTVPKRIQKCFEQVLGQIFRKKFLPSFPWGVESSKIFKKNKEFSKFQKSRKSLPKVSKRVLNLFWCKFFQKNCYPSVPWSVESWKIFKKIKKMSKFQPKTHKTVPKRIQKCFEQVLGQIFRKKFLPSFPWGVESSKIFKKNKEFSKFQKSRKSLPKVSKRVLNLFWCKFFQKNCYPSVPWSVESWKIFKKIKKMSKFQPKTHKTVPTRIQKCFEQVLGQIFRKNFCPVFHGWSSLRKFSKKTKNFQSSKKAENRYQKCPNVF